MRAVIVSGDRNATKQWEDVIGRGLEARARAADGKLLVIHSGDPGIPSMAGWIAAGDPWQMSELHMPALELAGDWSFYEHNIAMIEIGKVLERRGAEVDILVFHSNIERSNRSRDLINRALIAPLPVYLVSAADRGEKRIGRPIEHVQYQRIKGDRQMRLPVHVEIDQRELELREALAGLGMVQG